MIRKKNILTRQVGFPIFLFMNASTQFRFFFGAKIVDAITLFFFESLNWSNREFFRQATHGNDCRIPLLKEFLLLSWRIRLAWRYLQLVSVSIPVPQPNRLPELFAESSACKLRECISPNTDSEQRHHRIEGNKSRVSLLNVMAYKFHHFNNTTYDGFQNAIFYRHLESL